jgi:anti-sigma B factor antagonist
MHTEVGSMEQPARIRPADDGTVLIELIGDIDYTNAGDIVSDLQAAMVEPGPAAIRVDLSEVTFLDSSGIGVLVIAGQLAEKAGAGFSVIGATRNVYEQLRITGLVDLFGITPPGA